METYLFLLIWYQRIKKNATDEVRLISSSSVSLVSISVSASQEKDLNGGKVFNYFDPTQSRLGTIEQVNKFSSTRSSSGRAMSHHCQYLNATHAVHGPCDIPTELS